MAITIEKAIRGLTELEQGLDLPLLKDYSKDIALGIEALKRCKYISEHTNRWAVVLLPGEIKEDK